VPELSSLNSWKFLSQILTVFLKFAFGNTKYTF
jgi:hypothetical protein